MVLFSKTAKKIAENDFNALSGLGGEGRLISAIHGEHKGEGEKDYHLESIGYLEGVKGSHQTKKIYLKEIDSGGF